MAELAIHRFRFTLARAGGVSWGDDRAHLFAVARRDLPARIAEVLAARYPEGTDLEFRAPIRLALRVSLAELTTACRSDDALTALAERVVGAWSVSPLAEPADATLLATSAVPVAALLEHAPAIAASPDPAAAKSPLDAVLGLWRRGELGSILASLSVAALQRWLAWLDSRHRTDHVRRVALDDPQALREAITASVATLARSAENTVAEVTSIPAREAVRGVVNAQPIGTREAPVGATESPGERPTRDLLARRRPRAARQLSTAILDGLALPFLVLRPLAQIGYLDALAAGCHAIDEPDALPWIAYQLALQIAPPAVAAAFAGEREPPRPITDAIVRDALAPATRVAARAVIDGHVADRPIVLCRVRDALALVDPDGLFPIALARTLDELATIAAPITAMLAVPLDTADRELLRAIDARGWRFITDAPPTRGEHWHRVDGARAWTNDRITVARGLDALALTNDIVEALGARCDVPPSLKVAAGIALGDLAQRLWRDREPTAPQLARARFGDLTARITLAPDRVDVRIPRGARQRDLERAAFLGTHRPPWLGERQLDIGVG